MDIANFGGKLLLRVVLTEKVDLRFEKAKILSRQFQDLARRNDGRFKRVDGGRQTARPHGDSAGTGYRSAGLGADAWLRLADKRKITRNTFRCAKQ